MMDSRKRRNVIGAKPSKRLKRKREDLDAEQLQQAVSELVCSNSNGWGVIPKGSRYILSMTCANF